MNYDAFFGPAFPDHGWVPAPRYLMRRARVKELLNGINRGRLLEIGPGAGALLVEFADDGFKCEALEISREANDLASAVIAEVGHDVPVHSSSSEEWRDCFDVVCAFEVLEHIDDDKSALIEWSKWIKPGGVLLMSVPAHERLWTARDEWAGHYRRYERAMLKELFVATGFELEVFECYGFPLTNLTEFVSGPIYKDKIHKGGKSLDCDRKSNNDRSGIDRSPDLKIYPMMRSLPGKISLKAFAAIQKMFLNTDLGSGYIVKAKKI